MVARRNMVARRKKNRQGERARLYRVRLYWLSRERRDTEMPHAEYRRRLRRLYETYRDGGRSNEHPLR
jgi:hypothetical protein